jgi:hypothetical protein
LIAGLLFIGSLFIILMKRNNPQLSDPNLLMLIIFFLVINILTSFGNAIEWIQGSSEFDEIGDYVLTVIPLMWGGLFYALIENKHKQNITTAYNFSEFYKDILAHDMGNILQSILFLVEISELEAEDKSTVIGELSLIKDEIAKGEKLIKFSRLLSPDEYSSDSDVKLDVSTLFENVETRMKKKFTQQKIFINLNKELKDDNKKKNLESFTEILFVGLFTNLVNFIKKTTKNSGEMLVLDISIHNYSDKIEIDFPIVNYQKYLNENNKKDLFSTKRTSLETGISFSVIDLLFKSIGYKLTLNENKNTNNGLIIILKEY